MTWLDRAYVALVDVFWFPVTFPLSVLVGYTTMRTVSADRRGDVVARRAFARRGLSALHHPAMRAATAARLRALRSASCVVGAFKNHREYHELRADLEHLSR
jgi:hypothetical protein